MGEEYLGVKPRRLSVWDHPTLACSQSSSWPRCGYLSFQPHPKKLSMGETPSLQRVGRQSASNSQAGIHPWVWNSPGWASVTPPRGQSPFKDSGAIGIANTFLSFNNTKITCRDTHLQGQISVLRSSRVLSASGKIEAFSSLPCNLQAHSCPQGSKSLT